MDENNYSELSSFFPLNEWNDISEYDKKRNYNLLENYKVLQSCGLPTKKPDFLCVTKRKSEEQNCKKINKRIKFKPQIKRKDGNVSILRCLSKFTIIVLEKVIQDQIVGLSALNDAIRKLESELESRVEAEKGSEKESDVPGRRYPKRSLARKNYMEGNVLDDDEYIFCDDCNQEWAGDCLVHGALTVVEDLKVPAHPGDPTRADRTVPFQLCIAQSGISVAGSGVWTRVPLRKGLRFGPYEGAKAERSNRNGYCWQIHHNSRPLYCVDAKDCGIANWMRYVNCARHKEELNLKAFQYKDEIYYRTFQHIPAHVELLVWYGDEYGRELSIDVKNFHKTQQKQCHNVFRCVGCGTTYSSPLYLENHKSYCRGLKGMRLTQSGREVGVKRSQSNSIHSKLQCGQKQYQCSGHDSDRPTSLSYVKPVNLSIEGDMDAVRTCGLDNKVSNTNTASIFGDEAEGNTVQADDLGRQFRDE
ncbi:Histone-lysine N-methyltransferase PRDM9 [Zootermopsis nevadensis]|uniref:Histone-lysine N-methyltransferase PRDM9 n=1 Tax=Zootermopsis nevadensis TaxID=136037 RepID=A0A067R0H5_ZOONE|nr:Histone-lysine N-methyltransferase PRDM9 [Zootermopsis nevadensis]